MGMTAIEKSARYGLSRPWSIGRLEHTLGPGCGDDNDDDDDDDGGGLSSWGLVDARSQCASVCGVPVFGNWKVPVPE